MQLSMQPISIGFILAIVTLIVVIVLIVTGQLPFFWVGCCLVLLALSRLV